MIAGLQTVFYFIIVFVLQSGQNHVKKFSEPITMLETKYKLENDIETCVSAAFSKQGNNFLHNVINVNVALKGLERKRSANLRKCRYLLCFSFTITNCKVWHSLHVKWNPSMHYQLFTLHSQL